MRKVNYSFLGNKLYVLNDIAQIAQTLEKSDISKIDTENSTEFYPFLVANKKVNFYDEGASDTVEFIAIKLTDDSFNLLSNKRFIDKMDTVQTIDTPIKSISFENKDLMSKLLNEDLNIHIDDECYKLVFLSDVDLINFDYRNEKYYEESQNYYNYDDCTINRTSIGFTKLSIKYYSKYTTDVISFHIHLESVAEFLEEYK